MTGPGPSGRPEREPRALRDTKIEYVSVDREPGPYGGTLEVSTSGGRHLPPDVITAISGIEAFPERVTCPACHGVTEMLQGGSDGELAVFWEHLRTHSSHPLVLISLWVTAMGRAR